MEPMEMTKKNWINILLLGMGFLMIFTAFQTTSFVQSVTIDSFLDPECALNNSDANKIIDGGIPITAGFSKRIGYISLCIIYLMVAIGNWASVPIVAIFGAKWSCVISGSLYIVYLVALIRPYVPVIFFSAFILGSAGGVLWTAQGQILIQNSSKDRIGTTSAIFWLMLQTSLIVGNTFFFLYLYIRVKDLICIPHLDNYIIFSVFTLLGICGIIFLSFIQPVRKKVGSQKSNINSDSGTKQILTQGTKDHSMSEKVASAWKDAVFSIAQAIHILFSWDMFLLSFCFIYTGYALNFWSGVYGTIIGHTGLFMKADMGLAGLFIGLGEIMGGGVFGILGKYANRFGKDPIVFLGMVVHFAAYLLIYFNMPDNSIDNSISTYFSFGRLFHHSNIYIAMVCAFLLGFGDACFNTQVYAIIGSLYPNDAQSAPAMALFKFFQSLAAMIGFVTSTFIHLQWQLLVLVVLATLGTLSFAMVEWKYYIPTRRLPFSSRKR